MQNYLKVIQGADTHRHTHTKEKAYALLCGWLVKHRDLCHGAADPEEECDSYTYIVLRGVRHCHGTGHDPHINHCHVNCKNHTSFIEHCAISIKE